ncbi:MAG TPA: TolC family protein [Blastocatellia bacterium]|nr:TolC family protein [Blastocatellia bacterium]
MSTVLRKLYKQGRAIAAASLATMLSASMPIAAFAQEGSAPRQQPAAETKKQEQAETGIVASTRQTQEPTSGQTGQNPITQPLALSPEITDQRVGVDPAQKQLLALQDAISLALQNNLDIEAFRQGVQISQYNLFSLRGFYDVTSTADIRYRSQTTPESSTISGVDNSGSLTTKSLVYDFTTSQEIERTGGSYLINFNNRRNTTSNLFQALIPSYSTNLTFTFAQPLMRDFSIDSSRRNIQIARKSLDLSDSQFRQRVIEVINSVQRAYWDLVFAIRNEQIARDTVELTRVQLEYNRKLVEAGTLAPIELRSTEAALELRKGDVIVALQNITTAENVLKGLLLKDPNDRLWTSVIEPSDEPQFGETSFNLQEATGLALKNRPELDQMRLQTEQKNIDIEFFKNQTKPQVDFVGLYGNTGLAGTASTAIRPDGTPVGEGVLPRFRGGYFQSLQNLFGQDFRTYEVGVRLSFPWRNRTAEGNLGRSLAEARQLDARQRQLVQNVQIEVRNALQAVEAAKQRFNAARAARIAAEAQLAGEQERYRAGLSDNFLVLQRQTELSTARGQEVRALTDYNKALAELQRVTGMTLINNNVQVSTAITQNGK